MIKDFTNYQQALKLKSLGFDEQCVAFFQTEYNETQPIMVDDNDQYRLTGLRTCKNSEIPEHYTAAPTFSQAFRFFREKYGLQHDITLSVDNNSQLVGFYIVIHKLDPLWNEDQSIDFEVYTTDRDEAELACLDKLITLIK